MADLEESIAEDQKLRTYKNKRASFSFIGVEIAGEASATVTLPNTALLSITAAVGDPNITNPDRRMFAEPQVSLYEGSIADGNLIPAGDNLAPNDYKFWHWIDWGSTDINNLEISYITIIINNTGSSKPIIFKTNVRRIIT